MRPQLSFTPAPAAPSQGRLVVFAPGSDDLTDCKNLVAAMGVSGEATSVRMAVPRGAKAEVVDVEAVCVPLDVTVLRWLLTDGGDRNQPASVRAWSVAARIALAAVGSHHLLPRLVSGDPDDVDEHGRVPITAAWQVDVESDPTVVEALGRLADAMPASACAVALDDATAWDRRRLLVEFCHAVGDVMVREGSPPPSGRPRERLLPWTTRWSEALGDTADPLVPLRDDGPDLVAGVEGWTARVDTDATLVLNLDAPEDPSGPWTLTFAVRDPEDTEIPATEVWADPDRGLTEPFLSGLSRAARAFPPIDPALASESPTHVELDLDQVWQFLTDAAPLLSGSGVDVNLPAALSDEGINAQIRLSTNDDDGTVDAVWEIALADRVLDDAEVERLATTGANIAHHDGRWVLLDDEMRQALATRGHRETVGKAEALAMALAGTTGEEWFGAGTAAQRIVVDDGLGDLIDALRNAGDLREVPEVPEGFEGLLRPYQQRGVAWMEGMADLGMGAVLADAMGLGKTIQLIGLMLRRPGPFLVVCPTSVVGNWEREVQRFGPSLEVQRHHGTDRATDLEGFTGVLVTSYGTLRRDVDLLSSLRWQVVALDEAQQVKNPQTAAAQAVRALDTASTFALTGTPLENRLTELWAVIDATNRGLLGTQGTFNKRFVGPVEVRRDSRAAERLRRLVSPFIMRRTKDDPEVAKDLPDKIERTVVCALTKEQADLYKEVTKKALEELSQADGIGRRGKILALLTALKQVTNHPAQYKKEGGPILGRSGKLATLREIIGEVADAGDQALIFTQYTRMGDLLAEQLEADLGIQVPFLHGGLSLSRRDNMVADFQQGSAAPVLIVSTRAGGTGLNLTAATHVVHYDRWWNPAVEDQATDRAHRIGQTRTVEVHKLVTAGTIEERIAEMLERKRALADAVVGAGESWITELDDAALAELVSLSADAPLVDEIDERQGASR
ncbi:Helicase, SNF2/RAD54 family [Euzebya pacifica]|uniref:Helicase, SNF2/RAD54 family n=1 Tax=Euzebya pacifica TaxID=1608957 RepID=A0A346Y143_9ACTN|nr:Helicase, SNF2/RAD54 family [Euzebya pacifica]